METGHLSFYMSFLGHLYHLVIWKGSFNSRPGPMCSGLGRILLWAELFHWACAPAPFIRRWFGPAPQVFVLGLCTGCSLPYQETRASFQDLRSSVSRSSSGQGRKFITSTRATGGYQKCRILSRIQTRSSGNQRF